ncbi:hypothetical protein D920_00061 [Enterococcus faecalis 13-SD-W-01]|nr:hypothetical protein D920_00061 [Enterococcus faecalis 13-SD-W-01]
MVVVANELNNIISLSNDDDGGDNRKGISNTLNALSPVLASALPRFIAGGLLKGFILCSLTLDGRIMALI